MNKVCSTFSQAVRDIADHSIVMIDGFAGPGGTPQNLIRALEEQGAKSLTVVSNTAGLASVIGFGTLPGDRPTDIGILIENHQVDKIIASFPISPSRSRPTAFERAYREGEIELELVPQGTLAERIRAGGAGIPAFYTPTGVGTQIAKGKETRVFAGKTYVMEKSITADFALIRGYKADTLGNVVYKGTSQNFNGVMATAAKTTIVEVDELVDASEISSNSIATPGIYVDRIVLI